MGRQTHNTNGRSKYVFIRSDESFRQLETGSSLPVSWSDLSSSPFSVENDQHQ